jgi:hypothetical protein
MRLFIANFKWVMVVCGVLTCTMLLGLFAPDQWLQSNLGETLTTGPENLAIRGWMGLIGLMGIMLIYGGFHLPVRNYSLVIAGTNKIILIVLAFVYGKAYLSFGLGTAVVADTVMIVLFAIYLLFAGPYQKTDSAQQSLRVARGE